MAFTATASRTVLELSTDSSKFYSSADQQKVKRVDSDIAKVGTTASRSIASLGKMGPALVGIGAVAGTVAAAIGGITAATIALGQRGVAVADVADHFDKLTRSAGGSQAVLAGLQRGTAGVISNFELMKMANKSLGAGLVASAADMETLAAGSRMLANRVGGDTAQAFEQLTTAMAKGKVAGLKQLGLFVDVKEAVHEYAQAHKLAAADITDADRAAALQAATIKALRAELKNYDAGAADFGERIDQLKTKWTNFVDDLGSAIGSSAVVNEALATISQTIDGAFGNDQSERVQRLTSLVNDFVITLADVGQMGVTVADVIRRAWGGLQLVFTGFMSTIYAVGRLFSGFVANILDVAAKVPLVGRAFQQTAWQVRDAANQIRGMQESWHQQAQEALAAVQGNSSFHQSLAKVSTGLADLRGRLQLAASHQQQTTTSTAALTKGLGENSDATDHNTASTDKNAAAKRAAAEATEKQNQANMRWLDIQGAIESAQLKEESEFRKRQQPPEVFVPPDVPQTELESLDWLKRNIDAKEKADADYRQFRNEVGERQMEDEAARLKRLKDMREAALKPWKDLQAALTNAATSNLFTLFTGIGAGDSGAKQRAKEAREDYERLKASGTASAEALTRAFRAMHEANAAAQNRFSDRFKGWLGGIGHAFTNWINEAIGNWTKNFIGGLMKSLAGGLGKRIGGWFSSLLGGGGSGGGVFDEGGGLLGEVPNLLGNGGRGVPLGGLGKLLGKIPGLGGLFGGGGAAPGTVFGSGGNIAMSLGGAGGGGGALGFLANPAFWTNPWTIAAMVGIAAFPLIKKGVVAIAKGIGDGIAALAHGIGSLFDDSPGPLSYHIYDRLRARQGLAPKYADKYGHHASAGGGDHLGRFHTGGIVGDGAGAGEVFAKLLKGEAVLNRDATAALGSKVIDLMNAGQYQEAFAAVKRGEGTLGDLVSGFFRKFGHHGGIGGFFGGGPGALVAPMAPRLPNIALPDIRPRGDFASLPVIQNLRDGGSTAAGARTLIQHITINGSVADKAVWREAWKTHILPMQKFALATGEDGLDAAVRKAALL